MKKLPIDPGAEITLNSLEQKALKATSRFVGARHGDFIIVEDPAFHLNDRLYVPLTGELLCCYFHEGSLYAFHSTIVKRLGEGLTLISYPDEFRVEKVRRHQRIRVNIDARCFLENSEGPVSATLLDISEGGCRLMIPILTHVDNDMPCRLDFDLPDDQYVQGIRAGICSFEHFHLKKATELRLKFLGPPEQMEKVASFCRFCMFFRV